MRASLRPLILAGLVLLFSGCSFLQQPLGVDEGILTLELPLVEDYPADEYTYYVRSDDETLAWGLLLPQEDQAEASLVVPVGEWTVSGLVDTWWDDELGHEYHLPIPEQTVTVTANGRSEITLEHPLAESATVDFALSADAAQYISELSPPNGEIVGVFLYGTEDDVRDYHFHATDPDGTGIFTGGFARVLPGEYEIELVASNWTTWGSRSIWNPDLGAGHFATIQIDDDSTYSAELIHRIDQDFAEDSPFFEKREEGASVDLDGAAQELVMQPEVGGVGYYRSLLDVGLPKIYEFTYESASTKVNAGEPSLHLNFLADAGSGTRLIVTLDPTGIEVLADYGDGTADVIHSDPASAQDAVLNKVSVYLGSGDLSFWINTGDFALNPPSFSVPLPPDLSRSGRFAFEARNEVRVFNLSIRNDIRGVFLP